MNWIVSLSLNLRAVVVALAVVLMVVGVGVVRQAPLDVFPEFAPPLVEIQTEAPGLSTEEVESLVTVPIENVLNGTSWLKTLRSKSVLGLSSVVLIFQEGTDLMQARQLAQERLTTLSGQLPAVAHPPVILWPLSSTSRVMKIGVSSKTLSQTELTTLARWLVPQLEVRYRPEPALRLGLTPGDVRRAAATLVKGTKVGEIYEEQKIFDVVVWGARQVRDNLTALREVRIDLPSGGDVPLGEVAELSVVPAPNVIQREGASRRIDVTCDVRGRDLGSVAREIESKVRALPFERGYHPEFLGEYAARQQFRNRLLLLAGLSLLGILLLLHADFRSGRLVSLVFLTLPFALVGGVLSAFLSGGVLSLGSLVGFVTVLGIAARNGIMLVSHYRHLEWEEGQPFGRDLVLRGSAERLTPILMTALATALALLPIVVGGNRPGHEIEHPMAVVILGGLAASTLLNLFLLPALYLRFGRAKN